MRAYVCLGLLISTVSLTHSSEADDQSILDATALRMAREAVAAGADGDLDLREELLDRALFISPDCATARWARGEMLVEGNWISVSRIQDYASSDRLTEQYESRRDRTDDADDHLDLARWCRRNDLADEARYHWLAVLAADRENREALNALDSEWFEGELVSPEEAEQLRAQSRLDRKNTKHWNTRITAWRRALKLSDDQAAIALAELDSEVDESAVPAFERLLASRRNVTPAERERELRLCNQFIQSLGEIPSYDSTLALVRFAVLAPREELRTLAGEQLTDRPAHEFMPLLLDGLKPIMEESFEISVAPTGRVQYDHEVKAEGQNGDEITEISRVGGGIATFADGQTTRSVANGLSRARATSANEFQQYQAEAERIQLAVSTMNSQRRELNDRIFDTLEQTSSKDLERTPQAWWDDWYDENGYEHRSSLPPKTYRITSDRIIDIYIEPQIIPPTDDTPDPTQVVPPTQPSQPRSPGRRRSECFAAGTLVWTKTGTQAIETLTAGDLVLTMDERTGELTFRPVLTATRRAPSPLMQVQAGDYEFTTTPGHPFWVEGQGWKMARELEAGNLIRSASGSPIEVSAVVSPEGEDQEAFNLIVEGNNNYFVGVEGLLCHDNTPRNPELVRPLSR